MADTYVQYDDEDQCVNGYYVPSSNNGFNDDGIVSSHYRRFLSSHCKDSKTISASCLYNYGDGISPTTISSISKHTKCKSKFKCVEGRLLIGGGRPVAKATCVPDMDKEVSDYVRKCMINEAGKTKNNRYSLSGLFNTCAKIVGKLRG